MRGKASFSVPGSHNPGNLLSPAGISFVVGFCSSGFPDAKVKLAHISKEELMRKAWIRHLHNSLPVALAGVVIFGMATVCRAQTQTDPYSKMPTQASSRMAHRTARAHYVVTREELRTFSEFLKQHPKIASELKKVTWPTKDELVGSTIVVIVVSIVLAVFIGVVDRVLSFVVQSIFGGGGA